MIMKEVSFASSLASNANDLTQREILAALKKIIAKTKHEASRWKWMWAIRMVLNIIHLRQIMTKR